MYTVTKDFEQHAQHREICGVLDRVCDSDLVYRMAGNCLSACDIIQNMLSAAGVDSKIVECQAAVVRSEDDFRDFYFVGYNKFTGGLEDQIDTHVVVVTNTEPPVLIDAALGDAAGEQNRIIVRPLTELDPEVIGKFHMGDTQVTYTMKKQLRLPELHQKTLVERIMDTRQQVRRTQFVNRLLWGIGALTLINVIANTVLITIKLLE